MFYLSSTLDGSSQIVSMFRIFALLLLNRQKNSNKNWHCFLLMFNTSINDVNRYPHMKCFVHFIFFAQTHRLHRTELYYISGHTYNYVFRNAVCTKLQISSLPNITPRPLQFSLDTATKCVESVPHYMLSGACNVNLRKRIEKNNTLSESENLQVILWKLRESPFQVIYTSLQDMAVESVREKRQHAMRSYSQRETLLTQKNHHQKHFTALNIQVTHILNFSSAAFDR